jgi:hypothetical protein
LPAFSYRTTTNVICHTQWNIIKLKRFNSVTFQYFSMNFDGTICCGFAGILRAHAISRFPTTELPPLSQHLLRRRLSMPPTLLFIDTKPGFHDATSF